MKKKDIIVIVILCILLAGGYFVFQMFQDNDGQKDTIEVRYHKELIDTIDISIDKTYTYKGDYGEFHLEVKDEKYHAVNVECPNHDCEKIGWVNKGSSKSIVCLPNQIYVIQTGSGDNVQ